MPQSGPMTAGRRSQRLPLVDTARGAQISRDQHRHMPQSGPMTAGRRSQRLPLVDTARGAQISKARRGCGGL
jgi:hypothetical protein